MPDPIDEQMTAVEIGFLLLLSLLWGASFFFVEILIPFLPPLTITLFRVGLAAIALWAIIFATGVTRPSCLSQWGALGFIGFFNNALPFCLIAWGQTQIASGLASILNATAPLFTVVIAGLCLTDERLTGPKVLGVLLGILGVIGLVGPEALKGMGSSLLGQLAVIAAALSYAVSGVFSRRFSAMGLSPMMVATGQVTMATLMLIPLTFWVDGFALSGSLPAQAILALTALALLSTVLAYILYFRLIARAGATNAALVAFLVPVSAVALGALFLSERLTLFQFIGAGLIGLGLIVIDGRLLRRPKS